MAAMSPLASFILRAMRAGTVAAAAFIALVIGIELWKLWRFDGSAGNYGFLAVLGIMFVGALWLARSIGREIARHGS